MASISSSTSTNSTSSLGNTSLRGFGGMVSGIDRDSIIEQMTLRTKTKVANKQKEITKMGWKQEAYQSLSDKIIDWSDKYASYTSSSCLKDANMFAKKVITVKGLDESTRFVTATGTSEFLDNVSITGVKQLATASVRQSKSYTGTLATNVDAAKLDQDMLSSNLVGRQLIFAKYTGSGSDEKIDNSSMFAFTFPSSYKVGDETKTIDYLADPETLVEQLNGALHSAASNTNVGKLADSFKFVYDKENDKIEIEGANGAKEFADGYSIVGSSPVLKALGYTGSTDGKISMNDFNAHVEDSTFSKAYLTKTKTYDYLAGKKLTFNYNGSQKEIELITKEEVAAIKEAMNASPEQIAAKRLEIEKRLVLEAYDSGHYTDVPNGGFIIDGIDEAIDAELARWDPLAQITDNIQKRLNQAYGTGNVIAVIDEKTKTLSFKPSDGSSSVSVVSSDDVLLKNLNLAYGESSKINVNGKLGQSALHGENGLDKNISNYVKNGELDLVINGVAIKGLTADSSISDILSKINSTEAAGVKATYVDATGQFMLVASETGAGREINLDSELANDLFGGQDTVSGQNAIIEVSYGNGVKVDLNRASNTFNLEGLNVTVSGLFGGVWENVEDMDEEGFAALSEDKKANYRKTEDESGNTIYQKWKSDSAGAVTFSAKADVDGVTEKVKEFFEEYNALVKEINGYVTTRPDSKYEPLTDEQRSEMDDKSIENWEEKAKQGILYGDSTVQGLSNAMQGIFTMLMKNGASYDDLKKIGITYSEDWGDGGVLVFDEGTFRSAMESNPELVSNIFTGGGGVSKGLIDTMDDAFAPYATRYASKNASNGSNGHYGMLVEIAGSSKKASTLSNNQIYRELKTMNEELERLKELLSKEESRYISQFTTMESLINQYNTQSSYLSQITG